MVSESVGFSLCNLKKMSNYLVPIRYRHIKFSIGDQEKQKKKRERERKDDKKNGERERKGGRQSGRLREG